MAPPDDYGWAYIDPQRASASADGPSGSVQFRYGSEDLVPGQFSGSEDLVFYANNVGHKAANQDGSGSALYLYGNLYVTGAVYAEQYTIRHVTSTEIDISGSTIFGNTNDDNHQISGSLWVSREISGSEALNVQSSSSFGDYLLFHHSITGAAAATAAGGDGDIHVNKVIANDLFVSGSSTLGSGTKNVTTLYGTLTGSAGTDIHINDLIGNDGYFSGSVGIGTTSPARPLHIGDATNTDGNGTIRLQGYSAGGSGNYHEIKSSGDNLEFLRNTTSCLFLKYDGNVGIGTSSPSQQLDVIGNVELGSNSYTTLSDNEYDVSSGNLTVDVAGDVFVDAGGGDVIFKDDGTAQLQLNMAGNAGEIILQLKVDSDDLVFRQYDGNEVIRISDDRKLYFYDDGGEHISSDGTDLTIVAGADINLSAATDINIPSGVGLTFGNDAEKIEGDGTDLTIAGNNINLTAVADVNIPSGVGLTFATTEKIESDGTDLTITVGAGGDINIPANIGVTFGNDGEKIEGDGTDLTIAGNNINLTAVADVVIPADVGITFGSGEKIEGNDTDLTVTSGGAINLTATTDVVLPANVGVTFGSGEKIEGNNTNLTVTSGADINLNATDDVNLPANVGLTFGDDGEKIEGNGTRLIIQSGANMVLDSEGSIKLDSDTGDVEFLDGGTAQLALDMDGTNGQIDIQLKVNSDDLVFKQYDGNEVIRISDDRKLYFYDDGGEHISSDGTDLTVAAGGAINLTATTDVVLPADVGITFGSGEKIEGDNTNLTVTSGGRLDLTATGLVKVTNNTQLGTDQTDVTTFYGTLTGSQGAGEDASNIHANKIFANDLYVSGSATGISVSYGDSSNLNIGASNDLVIVHDGTNTKFVNTTGHLWFDNQDADDNIRFDLGTDDTATKFQVRNNSQSNLFLVAGSGLVSGSGELAIQGSASFGQPVTISGDLVFNAAATAGVIDIKVNDGSGADTAIQIAKAGKVTKIGDDVPSDGQLLTWDATAGKVKWDDGVVGISGSSVHYSSTELRTSGELNVSGSSTFAGVATHTAHPIFNTGLTIKNADASAGYINFYEQSSNGTNVCTFRGKSSMGNCTITLPGDTGTVVLEDNTVTLSNKTIASPTITGTTTFSDGDITNVGSIALDTITNDGTDVTIDSSGDIVLDAAGGNIEFKDAGTLQFTIDMDSVGGAQVVKLNVNSDDFVFQQYDGNEVIRIADDRRLYFYDKGGEYIYGDGTDLFLVSGADINIPADVGLTFGNDGEKIEGDGTSLTIASSDILNLDAAGMVKINSVAGDISFLDAGVAQLAIDMDGAGGVVAIQLKVNGDDLVFKQYDGTEVIRFTDEGMVEVAEAIVHTGDDDTKIVFDGNSLALHAGTSNQPQVTVTQNDVVVNEASADVNFRVESNSDTHAFYIDGGNADGTNGGMINLAGGYGNGGVAITNSGSLKMDGDLEVDGNATIIGDLTVAGNDIKSNTGNTVFSFDDDGNIDNDVTIQSATANLNLVSTGGKAHMDFYGTGAAMGAGADVGEINFYGTEDAGTGNSAKIASVLVESSAANFAYGSQIGGKMTFKVGIDGTTTLHNAMTITGVDDQNNTHARVGINTDSPSHALHVEANGSYDYAGFFKHEGNDADRYGIRIECGQDTMDTTNTLVWFADGNGSFLGKITATGTTVTYGTFTGAHETILESGETLLPYGTILTIKSVTSNVNQPEYVCNKSTAANDKAVLGVYSTNNVKDPEEARRDLHQVNALGDGHILVCSEGGDVETGDYICSSNVDGHGMKQDDDLLHNYTVAKASEPVDWSAETETIKLIACTYHCG